MSLYVLKKSRVLFLALAEHYTHSQSWVRHLIQYQNIMVCCFQHLRVVRAVRVCFMLVWLIELSAVRVSSSSVSIALSQLLQQSLSAKMLRLCSWAKKSEPVSRNEFFLAFILEFETACQTELSWKVPAFFDMKFFSVHWDQTSIRENQKTLKSRFIVEIKVVNERDTDNIFHVLIL